MNYFDSFIFFGYPLDAELIDEETTADIQINEVSKELDDSIENFVNGFIVDKLPSDSFIEVFVKSVNAGLLGKVQKPNAKFILSIALEKYLIKKAGILPGSALFKIMTNNLITFAIARSISQTS